MQFRNKIEVNHAEKQKLKEDEKARMLLNSVETRFEVMLKETEAKFDKDSKKEKKSMMAMKDDLEKKFKNL